VNVTLNQGYPDYVGRRYLWAGYANGPTSYTTGGETLNIGQFQGYIDSVDGGGYSVSGTYYLRPIPSAGGPRATWKVKVIVSSTNVEVAALTNLSAEVFQLSGKGGRY
jgi:hypothetical protein